MRAVSKQEKRWRRELQTGIKNVKLVEKKNGPGMTSYVNLGFLSLKSLFASLFASHGAALSADAAMLLAAKVLERVWKNCRGLLIYLHRTLEPDFENSIYNCYGGKLRKNTRPLF